MAKQNDFSVQDFRAAVSDFVSSVGPRAYTYISVGLDKGSLYSASLYPRGMMARNDELAFTVKSETLPGILQALKDKWADHSEKHRAEVTRKMALAIIRITAELGECTDAALRNCGEFDPAQIKMYGAEACDDANYIAGRGPFKIVSLGKANAPVEAA